MMTRTLATVTSFLLAAIILLGAGVTSVASALALEQETAAPAAAPDITVCGECSYTTIQEAVDAAPKGALIEVLGGEYDAPIVIDKPVRLVGVDNPVISGHDEGTIVRINADDTLFQGFTVRDSGRNFDREDSGVYVEGERVQVLDNQVLNSLFGVNAAQSHDLVVSGNYILGQDVDMGLRGDGIKVWYSHRSEITNNHVDRSRDLLVWYSNDVVVNDNLVENGRYGFHFMNSDDGTAMRNRLHDNSVGIYLMYGKRFVIHDNLLQGSRGPSGHGLGLKEIDGVDVFGNIIYDNRIGVYIDNSPLSPSVYNNFSHNLVAYNDSGLGVLPSSRNNVFTENSFVDNLEQVTVLGSGPMSEAMSWSLDGTGNFWSDYAGYDADGDGVGDVPYRSEQISEQLMNTWPVLQLYRFSLAETAVDFGSRAVPMFKQTPKLIDDHPLVRPVPPPNAPAPYQESNAARAQIWSLGLLTAAGIALWWGRGGRTTVRDVKPEPAPGRQKPVVAPAGTFDRAMREQT